MSSIVANVSGFPEFLPEHQRIFDHVLHLVKSQFILCGFSAMDTPAVEKTDTLLSKGVDHEIYGLYRINANLEDAKKDLALRFDLTVPLSRYVAQYYGKLVFPFRRYQIAPVWRGERPQYARYRQFYQCDIDILEDKDLSITCDAEVVSVMCRIFKQLNIDDYCVYINNAKLLKALISSFGVDENSIAKVLQIIDKWDKIEGDPTSLLYDCCLSPKAISVLMDLMSLNLSNDDTLLYMRELLKTDEFSQGIKELELLLHYLRLFCVPDQKIKIKPSLARGLNYYTGSIFEIVLDRYPGLGSVCGGGRYENLVSTFCKYSVRGVGLSLGLSRLVQVVIEEDLLGFKEKPLDTILFAVQDSDLMSNYIEINNKIRDIGISIELYLGDKSLSAQMKYANRKGFGFVIMLNAKDFAENRC